MQKTGLNKKKSIDNHQKIRFVNMQKAKIKVKTIQREVVPWAVKTTDRGCILEELVPKNKVRGKKVASQVMSIFGGL